MELDTASTTQLGQRETVSDQSKINLENLSGSVHLVGIGGIGMSGLARLLLARGVSVSGSDKEETAITKELASLGAHIAIGHDAANVNGAALVVVSSAIVKENPEIAASLSKSLPIWHRSQMLTELAASRRLIAVSGTHGKTTTTGMLAQVLLDSGLDPSIVVGGIFSRIGANSHAGKGEYFVAETDESDRTQAQVKSYVSIITNVEAEHLENYPGGIAEIQDNMVAFANQSQHLSVICADDSGCLEVIKRLTVPHVTYGSIAQSPHATYVYQSTNTGMRVFKQGKELGEIALRVPGDHNRLNALAVVACSLELGLEFEKLAASMSNFAGVNRRFQILGEKSGIVVVDDYAHHPTEVAAVLQAADQYALNASKKRRIVVVFQPHQPGRLRDFWDQFCRSFKKADLVLVADIYIARGGAIEGVSSEKFAKEVDHPAVHYLPGKIDKLAEDILPYLKSGDLVLTVGAGDITKLGFELLKRLN